MTKVIYSDTEKKNVALEMFDKVSLLCYWNMKHI